MSAALSPSRRVQTNVAFPVYAKETQLPTLQPSSSDKVIIESCADFLDQYVSGSRFGTKTDSKLVHDMNGQPMVLSIGSDQHVYLCVYVNGALGGWTVVDVNPTPSFKAAVFDMTKGTSANGILFAVSGYESDKSRTEVWQAKINCPAFVAPENGNVDLSSMIKLPWTSIGGLIATRNILSLVCTPLPDSTFRIVAAVNATSKLEGSYLTRNSGDTQQDWKPLRLAQQVETVLSCTHGNLPKLGQGEFVLFQDASAQKASACLFQAAQGAAKQIFLTDLNRPNSLSTSVNDRGLTDLWITTDDGIGYVNYMKLGEAPERLLPGIKFSKVFAVESRTVDDFSKLLVFALSSYGELYIIEGRRPAADKKTVSFEISQVPIRSNIRTIAGNLNPGTNASEIVYVSRDNDNLVHLARDPVTCLWKETELVVKSKEPLEKIKLAAYVVNISLTNGKGAPVPAGFQVQLTSAACLAYVNERTYNLDERPQTLNTDQFGRMQIVVPVSNDLGAAPIGLRFLPDSLEPRVFYIQPAQRVLDVLSSLKTGEDLKNAKTADGRYLFPASAGNHSQESFNQVAQVFANLPAMVKAVDPAIMPESPPMLMLSKFNTVIDWQKGGKSSDNDRSWLDNAVDSAGTIFGDFVEFLKTSVKHHVKVAMRVVGPIISFVVKFETKVWRFILGSTAAIVNALAHFLASCFGIEWLFITDFFKSRIQTSG